MGKHQLCGGWSELGIAGRMGVSRLSKQKVYKGKRVYMELGKESGHDGWYTGVQQGVMAIRPDTVGPG